MSSTLRALVNQAERLVRAESYEEAIAVCHAILRRHPRYARCYRILGEAHLGLGQHGEAADLFRRALGVDPEDPIGYAGLGIIFAERGLLDEAIWQFERAFELAPGRDGLRRELARLYQARGASQSVQLTRAALARLYTRGGLWNKAIGELRSLLAREPYRLDLRASLARTLWRAGEQEEAARAAQAIVDQAPNCLVARLILGACLCCEGRTEEGQEFLRGVRELDPEDREATRLIGEGWPWLRDLMHSSSAGGAAEAEIEVPELPANAATQMHAAEMPPLPDWLDPADQAPDSAAHIVTMPEESIQALLANLAEQEAAIEGDADLPFAAGDSAGTSLPQPWPDEWPAAEPADSPGVPAHDEAPAGVADADAPPALLSAASLLERRIEAAPEDHEGRLELARALARAARLGEALAHYDALTAVTGYLDIVIADLEALAQANAHDRALRECLGDAYARAGRFQDAMTMYRWRQEHGDENDARGG